MLTSQSEMPLHQLLITVANLKAVLGFNQQCGFVCVVCQAVGQLSGHNIFQSLCK